MLSMRRRHPESGVSRKAFKGQNDSWSPSWNGIEDGRDVQKPDHSQPKLELVPPHSALKAGIRGNVVPGEQEFAT